MISVFNKNAITNEDLAGVGKPILDNKASLATYHSKLNGDMYIKLNIPYRAEGIDINTLPNELDILKIIDMNDEEDYFRIRKVKITLRNYEIYAEHITYDLIDNMIEDIFLVNMTGQMGMDAISKGAQFPHRFKLFSDINTTTNIRIVRKNVMQAILGNEDNTFISRYGGELKRLRFNLYMNKRIGRDLKDTIRSRKNLTGFERDIDINSVATRLMPKAQNGILLPEKYVDSPLIGNYPHPKIKQIDVKAEFEGEFDKLTTEQKEAVYSDMRKACQLAFEQGIDKPKATYKVNFVTLENTEEYKDYRSLDKVNLGDVIEVYEEEFGMVINAKVIEVEYDLLNKRYIQVVLGSFEEGLVQSKMNLTNTLAYKIDEVNQTAVTALVSANGKNTNYYTSDIPVNPDEGDTWFKEDNTIWQYKMVNGKLDWVEITVNKERLDEQFNLIETRTKELLHGISNAEASAKSAYDRAGVGESLAKEFEKIIQQGGYASLKDSLGDVSLATEERLKDGFKTMVYNPDGSLAINEITSKYIQDSIIDDDYISNQIQTSEMIQNVIKAQVPVPTDAEIQAIAEATQLTKADIETMFADGFLSDADIQEIAAKAQIDPEKVKELVNGQISNAMVQKYEDKVGNKYYLNDENIRQTFEGHQDAAGNLLVKDYELLDTMQSGAYKFEVHHENNLLQGSMISFIGTLNNKKKSFAAAILTQGQNVTTGTFTIPIGEYYGNFSNFEVSLNQKSFISSLKIWQEVTTKVPIETGSGAIASKLTQLNNNIDMALFGQAGAISRINVGEDGLYLKGDNIRLDGTVHMDDAFATNVFAKNIETDTFKAHSAVIANAIVDKLDVNQMTGYSATWVQNVFNGVYSRLKITGDGIDIVDNSGRTSTHFDDDGIDFHSKGDYMGSLEYVNNTSSSGALYGKNGISFRPQRDGYFGISYFPPSGGSSIRAFAVDGATGYVYMQTEMYPSEGSNNSLKLSDAGKYGIALIHNDSKSAIRMGSYGISFRDTDGSWYNLQDILRSLGWNS